MRCDDGAQVNESVRRQAERERREKEKRREAAERIEGRISAIATAADACEGSKNACVFHCPNCSMIPHWSDVSRRDAPSQRASPSLR
jgi:hypothetical protein